VEGYAEMTDETFARRFHGDRADLAKVGIEITCPLGDDVDDAQVYVLSDKDFHLPEVEFTAAELRALSVALAALDGRFPYARPLRLALTAVSHGDLDPVHEEIEHLPIAFAPDEDARRSGKQLARLEDAVTRGKSVSFAYPDRDGTPARRALDPYSLFLIQGHWYVVGADHSRQAIRTFRVGRIRGAVKFLTEKTRDFTPPPDYDPAEYRARPPWAIGPVRGRAVLRVGDDLAWWVARLEPHVSRSLDDDEGCVSFSIPYSDEEVLLSWVAGLGGCAELLAPDGLRERMRDGLAKVVAAHAGPPLQDPPVFPRRPQRDRRGTSAEVTPGLIRPEHLARAISLLNYLTDERRPEVVPWRTLADDLGLSRAEIESDIALLNLVNFGGGTYALYAEAADEGVLITREVMADAFARPARLSPLMARALLLALDLLGDTVALEGMGSLASVRAKVLSLVGESPPADVIMVDDVLPPDHEVLQALNQSIRDRRVVSLEYFTTSREELTKRQVEPYLLFHSSDGWYLEAFCLKAQAQRTFKLDRIRSAQLADAVFAPRPEVDLGPRRAGRGFASEGEADQAFVRFQPRWRTFLEESGLEHAVDSDGTVLVCMPYLDERWLAREVVRFLGDAVAESPSAARGLTAETAATLAARYGDR